MARNPVARNPRSPAPISPAAKPWQVVAGLLVSAAVVVAAISWLAGGSAPKDEPARPATGQPLESDAQPPPADEGQGAAVEAAPVGRPFMDATATAATAYAAGDYEAALASYQDAVQRNPSDAEAHSNLGQLLVRLKRPGEAVPHFDRAISLIPDRWAYHFNRGRALALLQQWDASIAAYRTAEQLYPDDYAIAFNLAQTLHRKGDEAAAVEQYRRAIALDPNDASFRLALGISLEKLQKPADAALAYGEYLRLAPQAPDAEKVRARIAQLTRPPS